MVTVRYVEIIRMDVVRIHVWETRQTRRVVH